MSNLTEDLKSHVDIMEVIGRAVDLKRAGSNYTGLCPFHREKSPSFMVSQDRQTYKCFGCGLGGDVISFIMEYEKMDFWDAIKELATRYHFDLTPYKSEKSSIEGYLDTKDQREKLKLINKLTGKWFHEQLAKHPEASDYVHNRRHLNDDIITRRQIGYAPTNGQLLNQYLQSKGFTIADLTEAGLIKQSQSNSDVYSFFRHRMMFPISDHVGNIVGFGGRIINPEDNPKYLNTGDTELYRKSNILYGLHQAKSHIKTHDQVIVVEGYMDVIALDRLGMSVGVAPCGTSLTVDHVKLLTRYTQNIVLMFDNDNAGQTAGIRSVKLLLEQGIYPKLLRLSSPYKDIDDLANSDLSDDEKQTILTSTVDRFDALVTQLQITYPLDHPVAMKQLINEMFAVLDSINDHGVLLEYLNKLADKVNTLNTSIFNDFNRRKTKNRLYKDKNKQKVAEKKDTENISFLVYSLRKNYIQHIASSENETLKKLFSLCTTIQDNIETKEITQEDEIIGEMWRSRKLDKDTENKNENEVLIVLERYFKEMTPLVIKSTKLNIDQKTEILSYINKKG